MQTLRKFLLAFFALLLALPAQAQLAQYNGFTTRNTGYTVQATDWDNEFGNFIAHYNNNAIATFNLMATAGTGAMLMWNGANFAAIGNAGAGTDGGKVLTLSGSTGLPGWVSFVSGTALTVKGQILGYSSAPVAVAAPGSDGLVLTSRTSAAPGVDWEAGGVPSGTIVLWSGSIATIPNGWALCDGQVHSGTTTVNLQGVFVLGAGNASPGVSGGIGLVSPNVTGGNNTHAHGLSNVGAAAGAGVGVASSAGTAAANNVPFYVALCYMQKL